MNSTLSTSANTSDAPNAAANPSRLAPLSWPSPKDSTDIMNLPPKLPTASACPFSGQQSPPGEGGQEDPCCAQSGKRDRDLDRRSRQQAAAGLKYRSDRIEVGNGVNPTGEQRQGDVHRGEEEEHEHGHLNQGPGLFGAKEHG